MVVIRRPLELLDEAPHQIAVRLFDENVKDKGKDNDKDVDNCDKGTEQLPHVHVPPHNLRGCSTCLVPLQGLSGNTNTNSNANNTNTINHSSNTSNTSNNTDNKNNHNTDADNEQDSHQYKEEHKRVE